MVPAEDGHLGGGGGGQQQAQGGGDGVEDHQVPRLPGPEVHHRHSLHSLIKYIFTS